jgi:hypothetical protein
VQGQFRFFFDLTCCVLWFLWGTNWIYICYVEESRPPLWPSAQSSWLQIQRSGFDSQLYQIFWEVMGLERGPLSLVSTIEELIERKSSCSSLENREYGRKDLLCWPRSTLYSQKLALSSPKSGGRSVGIIRSPTQATEFVFLVLLLTSWPRSLAWMNKAFNACHVKVHFLEI